MDGKRIQEYWSSEVSALVATYRQFETLIPSADSAGAAHRGEDGRFVEDLVREYLSRYLPASLEVFTGFILRPAVKTGGAGRERENETDAHSSQLDILIYDSANYPIFQRFGNSVIVPPEGVIGIISVKKHLHDQDVEPECKALYRASRLCGRLFSNDTNRNLRGPFLALICVHSNIKKEKIHITEWIFERLRSSYEGCNPAFDNLIGYLGALDEWSVFKRRPKKNFSKAEYVGFTHQDNESHMGLQFLLTGILSVFYDETRRNIGRPGFTAFSSNRSHDKHLGDVPCTKLRE